MTGSIYQHTPDGHSGPADLLMTGWLLAVHGAGHKPFNICNGFLKAR